MGYVTVASTDGVVRVLGDAWDALQSVPDDQVDAVRRARHRRPRALVRCPGSTSVDRVRILDGPLAGLEGLVRDRRRGRATFVVNVDLLQRSVGVEVDAALLERC